MAREADVIIVGGGLSGLIAAGDVLAAGYEPLVLELDQMAETVPVDAPWLAPEAEAWDRVTTGQWYDSQGLSQVARTLLEICTVGILAVPAVEVSLLCLLQNVAVCGVTADLLAESEGGAQTRRFVGGTSQIPLRLAAALGGRIALDSAVLATSRPRPRAHLSGPASRGPRRPHDRRSAGPGALFRPGPVPYLVRMSCGS
jgi:monoamine oxidase